MLIINGLFVSLNTISGLDHTVTPSRAVAIRRLGNRRQISESMDSGRIIMTVRTHLIVIQANHLMNLR